MTTMTDTLAIIAGGWEHTAAYHRAEAERHRGRGDLTAALLCDAEASVYERNAAQLRRSARTS